ncbi:MAG: hypothetical protein CMF62_02800 [Magnetococcales bacterium]|nr:hypothetical protein [Magnetococcales bacterium]|tara:strand:- start:23640 stop:25319 length:1680 start_codon:yes stop_codon:yes gene_type:complete
MGIKKAKQFIEEYASSSISKHKISYFADKYLAVDASLIIYQIAIATRGRTTSSDYDESMLISSAIFYRVMIYLSNNIVPIFIFDGKQPEIRRKTLEKRRDDKKKALDKLIELKEKDNLDSDESVSEEKIKWSKRSFTINSKIIHKLKTLLSLMGLPWIQSPEEADSQCAALSISKSSKVWGVVSEDTDLLAFGTPYMLKDFSHKKDITLIDSNKMLKELNFTKEEFIDFCILLGTEYSSTIKGLGASTAYKKYHSCKSYIKNTQHLFTSLFIKNLYDSKELSIIIDSIEMEKLNKKIKYSTNYLVSILDDILTKLNGDEFIPLKSDIKKLNTYGSFMMVNNIILQMINSKTINKNKETSKNIFLLLLTLVLNIPDFDEKINDFFEDIKQKTLNNFYKLKIDPILIEMIIEDNMILENSDDYIIPYLYRILKVENKTKKTKKYSIPSNFLSDWKNAKKYYLEAQVQDPADIEIKWDKPNKEAIISFLKLAQIPKSSIEITESTESIEITDDKKINKHVEKLMILWNNKFEKKIGGFPTCFDSCKKIRSRRNIRREIKVEC